MLICSGIRIFSFRSDYLWSLYRCCSIYSSR